MTVFLLSLKKIEHLEVLSLAGIETVCDVFIKGLAIAHSNNMMELVLSNCVDEAIAAFLGTSGKLLEELSLNNVWKVGINTPVRLLPSVEDACLVWICLGAGA